MSICPKVPLTQPPTPKPVATTSKLTPAPVDRPASVMEETPHEEQEEETEETEEEEVEGSSFCERVV